ncbi:MAG: archaellin/type IV pilin N-terminal domain-containing protein [Candidatus Syntropharchaeia archaeon]
MRGWNRKFGLGKFGKDKRAFTGLEAAIVLTAFVVVAAVFSYVVLNAGFFTTQKSKEVIHTGVEQATSSAELAGSVIGYSLYYNDSLLTLTNLSTTGSKLNATRFYLQLTAGESPMDMEGLTISYKDEDTHVGNLTYNASAGGGELNTTEGKLNLKPGEWNYTILTTTGFGDSDNLLELGEKAQITVALPEGGVAADEEFVIEVKPAKGASLSIERTAPSAIDAVMDLT